jgi:adenine deaminase
MMKSNMWESIPSRSFMRALPKAELHIHLEGALEPELALGFAQRNRMTMRFRSVDELRRSYQFTDLQSFLNLYYECTASLVAEQDFYDLTLSYLQRAAADGVRHAEIFFDPQSHTNRGVKFETVITGIRRALEVGRRQYEISSNLIMCFLRHLSADEAMETLEMALPFRDQILGVGLDSSELGHPPMKFVDVFARARDAGFRRVAHAGEEGPPDYIWQALDLLGAERIDHGVRALEDDSLMRRLAKEQIPLTVCPLSNVRLGVFPSMSQHNLKRLLDAGLLVTINSDDPAYFGGYVSDNYVAALEALNLNREDVERLAANSFRASFLPAEDKRGLLDKLESYTGANFRDNILR